MNAYLAALLTVLAPLYCFLIPGLVIIGWHRKKLSPPRLWLLLGGTILFLLLFTAFSIPFLYFHNGLPTGDSQKAIIWANQIQQENRLPNYQEAITWLNRDPTDFFTPGLHVVVAAVSAVSPHPLVSVGLLSIALSIATAFIGGAVGTELTTKYKAPVFALTVLFILTNFRFLRYLREPGYHLQNILGELLLFSLLWLALRMLRRGLTLRDLLLATVTTVALVTSHQFSAFLAPFLLLPAALLIVRRYPRLVIVGVALIFIGSLAFWLAGLTNKLPHVFTSHPHLLSFTPTLTDYPALLSLSFLLAGLVGWIYLARQRTAPNFGFVAGAVLLLTLSQAPRCGLDIPPVRALFYSIVPLSIGAAFFFTALARKLAAFTYLRMVTLAMVLLAMTVPPVSQAFNLSHGIRTNSTLLPEQLMLIDTIKQHSSASQAVLIDDYNRRSASWLVLSGQPMFTRLAADIATQQNEARQSALRRSLYLNQLDFEKIFSLGSQPEIASLLDKHSIRWLTGIEKSSVTAFAYNPVLHPGATGGDITLFEYTNRKTIVNAWLLKPSTVANDIGDEEDEFKHLPLSLRAPNLSEPHAIGNQTFRTTTAPAIPLMANVHDYVAVLWDQDKDSYPDSALQLLVRFTHDPGPLTLTTSTGQHFTLKNNQPLPLPASTVPIIDGTLTLIIENPAQQSVAFDLVALGTAPTP